MNIAASSCPPARAVLMFVFRSAMRFRSSSSEEGGSGWSRKASVGVERHRWRGWMESEGPCAERDAGWKSP
eukprot:29998-Pelagococcus_subviridis.AAC.2